jgi:fatty acid desaturase
MSRDTAIWHVPLAILAGISALLGLGVAILGRDMPEPYGLALPWGFAGAAFAFIGARIAQTRRVTRRELELIALAGGIFVAPYFLIGAVIVLVLGVGTIFADETKRAVDRNDDDD